MKFDPTINMGAILQAGVLGATVLIYIVGVRSEVATLTRDVQQVNARLTTEVGNLSTAIRSLSDTLSPFARMMERMDGLDRRIAGVEIRNEGQDERLNRISEAGAEMRANLDTLMRASSQNLPGAPGVRAR